MKIMSKQNSWFRLNTISAKCSSNIYFGITDRHNERDYLYPERIPSLNSTVIWVPDKKAHISVASYVDAFRNGDEAAIEKLRGLGVPPGIDFGYGQGDDLSCMYEVKKDTKPRKKKADSVKVMRAAYGSRFEDGGEFRKGDVVKIVFRKKFVKTTSGGKKFENAYERPTEEELAAFLAEEKGGLA